MLYAEQSDDHQENPRGEESVLSLWRQRCSDDGVVIEVRGVRMDGRMEEHE